MDKGGRIEMEISLMPMRMENVIEYDKLIQL